MTSVRTLSGCCGSVGDDVLTEPQAEELATLLKALADPVRIRLVSIIATAGTGEVCACDLTDSLERSQPTISHHLGLLVRAGVLEREQRGKWAWFRVRRDRLDEIATLLRPCSVGEPSRFERTRDRLSP